MTLPGLRQGRTPRQHGDETDRDTSRPVAGRPAAPAASAAPGGFRRLATGDRIAAVVLAMQLVVTLAVVWRGGLYQDDIRAIIFISGLPFADSLLWTNGTHVVPGTHAVLWVHGRLFGLDYAPAIVVITVLRLGASYAVWRMLRRLFGATPAIATVFAFTALTPMALSATAWYAQALTLLPVQLATALAVLSLSSYHRTRQTRHIVGTVLAVALGLCFAEKALVLFAFLPTLYCLAIARVTTLRATVVAMAETSRVWASLGVLGLVWIFTYTSAGGMDGHPVSGSEAVRIASDHAWLGFLPTLVGGPWTWRLRGVFYEDSPYFAIADPPVVASLLGAAVFALMALAAFRFRRRAAVEASVVLLSFYLPCYLLVTLARGHLLSGQLGVDLRFWADTVPAVGIAAGMVLAGARTGGRRPVTGLPLRVLAVAAVAWLAGTAVTVATFAAGWHRNDNAEFLARLERAVERLDGSTGVYETELPRRVISAQFGAETSNALVLPWLDEDLELGRVREQMLVVTPRGDMVPAAWSLAADGTNSRGCGWELAPRGPRRVRVELSSTLPARRNQSVLVTARASAATSIGMEVRHDGGWSKVVRQDGVRLRWRMPLPPGGSTVAYALPAGLPVDALRLSRRSTDAGLCVSRVEVGRPVPAGGAPPRG